MKVILKQDIKGIGKKDEIHEVSGGCGRCQRCERGPRQGSRSRFP